MTNHIYKRISESIDTKKLILESDQLLNQINEISLVIINSFRAGGSVYFCGNGGSAADAQHLAAELSGRFYLDRDPLSAEALHCNTSFLTAVANDYSFDNIYSRMIKAIGKKGDVLIGLSTSGNSTNIVNSIIEAKKMGLKTISMTGNGGGQLRNLTDIDICIPSSDTPRIQEAHIMVGHIICELVEYNLFSK